MLNLAFKDNPEFYDTWFLHGYKYLFNNQESVNNLNPINHFIQSRIYIPARQGAA